jgi:hypothetical protein
MPTALARALQLRIDTELPYLQALAESVASVRPSPGAWSSKEELGHLIDSAANNHIRFVNAAIGAEYRGPGYAQNEWVRLHGYQEIPMQRLAALWHAYNCLLADLIARIPPDRLGTRCFIGSDPPVTLQFVIEDYGVHLQHHVDHLLHRPTITVYPQVGK